MTLTSTPKPEVGDVPGKLTGPTAWPRKGQPCAGGSRVRGRREGTAGQPHQDQDVGHDDVVTLQAAGLVGLEPEAAVLEEGHRVVVIEGDVGLVPELPAERKPVGQRAPPCTGWQHLPRSGPDSCITLHPAARPLPGTPFLLAHSLAQKAGRPYWRRTHAGDFIARDSHQLPSCDPFISYE